MKSILVFLASLSLPAFLVEFQSSQIVKDMQTMLGERGEVAEIPMSRPLRRTSG